MNTRISPKRWWAVCGLLLGATPALALDLYFNSYGWDKIYRLDTISSQVERLSAANISEARFFKSADFAQDGRLYGIGEGSLFAVDVSGSSTVWTEQYPIAEGGDYLSFAPDDQLWVAKGSWLRRVSPGGATVPSTAVPVTYQGSEISLWGMDFAANGALYAIDASHLYQVDPLTGISSRMHSRPNLNGGIFAELDVAADGVIRMLGSYGYLYEYNPQTDQGAWRPEPLLYEGAAFNPSSLASQVPEPSVTVLLLLGLLGGAFGLRRGWRRRITPDATDKPQ